MAGFRVFAISALARKKLLFSQQAFAEDLRKEICPERCKVEGLGFVVLRCPSNRTDLDEPREASF